ncbi:type II secretion system protein N [Sphingomonas sp. MMS24-J13]|uniref:type II secretion system protein N n=1 Tax=Sphingomonas sp. MMS24-J13 TaxID=3238686 RepID=UPI00384E7653
MTPRQARIGADIFTGLVVVSVGVALAGLTWRLLGDPGTRFGASPVAARPTPPVDIAPLIALAPFGAAPGTSMQASDQPLTLRGILLAEPRSASTVLISVGDAAPIAFGMGQAVGGATIDSIAIDHVVLLSGGARTMLGFPRATGGAAPVSTPPVTTPAPPSSAPLLDSLGAVASGAGLAVNNPNAAMRMAGLLPGDQIVAINGAPALELTRNPALLQPIVAAGSARIDIVRAGQKLTLSVPIR